MLLERRTIRIGRLAVEERLLLRLLTWGTLLALAAAVALLRFQRLDELPPGLLGDEDRNGLAALHVLQGEHAVFFPQFGVGREASTVYVLALSTLLFGRTLFAIHLPTALGSAGMVFGVFWMGRLLFGRSEEGGQATPWRGLLIGGVASGLMAVSLGQTILGRTGYNRTTHMPLILTLCLGLLWWGWKERKWRWVVLAGICAGILPYTYYPARLAPILFLSFGLSFLFPLRARIWERVRAEIPWAAAFVAAAAFVTAPLLVYFALHPEHFLMRTDQLWVFAPEVSQGAPLRMFLINAWDHVGVLGFSGDPNWQNNYASRPMLNPWEAVFFWLGVGLALWHWRRRPDYRLLILWTGVMLLPAVLARDEKASNTLRMIAAAPAIYLLLGVGVWEVFQFLQERFFGEHRIRAGIFLGSVVAIAVLTQGFDTHRTYFRHWATAPEVQKIYLSPLTDFMEDLKVQLSRANELYLFPRYGDYAYRYLHQGQGRIHLFDPYTTAAILAQEVETVMSNAEGLSTVKVVEWTRDSFWIGHDARRVAFLLTKYGRYQGSEEFPGFRIHSFAEVSTERPWTFYTVEPVTVKYDGGIALQGLALGQGATAVAISAVARVGAGQAAVDGSALADCSRSGSRLPRYPFVFTTLRAKMVYQEDAVLRNRVGNPTKFWLSEEAFDFLSVLELAEDYAGRRF